MEDDRIRLKAAHWKVAGTSGNLRVAGTRKGGWKAAEYAGRWQRSLEDSRASGRYQGPPEDYMIRWTMAGDVGRWQEPLESS
jgi:hypothetical protein